MPVTTRATPRSLTTLTRGDSGVVDEVRLEGPDLVRLDALGLRADAPVRVCSCGRVCVVLTVGKDRCRLALERRLAQRVMIAASHG